MEMGIPLSQSELLLPSHSGIDAHNDLGDARQQMFPEQAALDKFGLMAEDLRKA